MELRKRKETQDETNTLTSVYAENSLNNMIQIDEIVRLAVAQIKDGEKSLEANAKGKAELEEHITRYRNLDKQDKQTEAQIIRAAALLPEKKRAEWKATTKPGRGTMQVTAADKASLWQIIVALLELFDRPLQLSEIQDALNGCGHNISRQAIYSAMDTHKDTFEIKSSGRAKFASLKQV